MNSLEPLSLASACPKPTHRWLYPDLALPSWILNTEIVLVLLLAIVVSLLRQGWSLLRGQASKQLVRGQVARDYFIDGVMNLILITFELD